MYLCLASPFALALHPRSAGSAARSKNSIASTSREIADGHGYFWEYDEENYDDYEEGYHGEEDELYDYEGQDEHEADEDDVPEDLNRAYDKTEEAFVVYFDARKKMRELANSRGFYPVAAVGPDFQSDRPPERRPAAPRGKGKGKGRGKLSRPSKGRGKGHGKGKGKGRGRGNFHRPPSTASPSAPFSLAGPSSAPRASNAYASVSEEQDVGKYPAARPPIQEVSNGGARHQGCRRGGHRGLVLDGC